MSNKKIKSLAYLLKNEIDEPSVHYATNIEWIDDIFDGGFEAGQLIAILGDAEAGKTQLLNQMLINYGRAGHKVLYFSLEFNERKLKAYFRKKIQTETATYEALENIFPITSDMLETDIDTIEQIIRLNVIAHNIKIVAIDSTMMIYANNMSGESEVTEIFRRLHNLANELDIILFAITQASKDDLKGKKVSIFGSQRANHFCSVILFIGVERDEETNDITERHFIVHKNKQNGEYAKKRILLNKDTLELEEARVGINAEAIKDNGAKNTTIDKPKSVWEVI